MSLTGKRVAILAEDNYQVLELWYPLLRFKEAGADVQVVAPGHAEVHKSSDGYPVKVDLKAADARGADFDAVVVPGGFAPDRMRVSEDLLRLVREANEQNKVVAAICHAGWVLASADIVRGKKLTCFRNIKDDMINAGAEYVDEEVVVDGNLITSRTPPICPPFAGKSFGPCRKRARHKRNTGRWISSGPSHITPQIPSRWPDEYEYSTKYRNGTEYRCGAGRRCAWQAETAQDADARVGSRGGTGCRCARGVDTARRYLYPVPVLVFMNGCDIIVTARS